MIESLMTALWMSPIDGCRMPVVDLDVYSFSSSVQPRSKVFMTGLGPFPVEERGCMRIGDWLTADQGERLLAASGGEDLRARLCHEAGGSLNKFSSCSVMSAFKQPNGTSAASNGCEMRSTIKSVLGQRPRD